MKVGARFSNVRPLLTISDIFGTTASGPSGQVPTATGSNSPSVAWGSNVAVISADNQFVYGPFVNFASGSNITLTRDAGPGNSIPSNTIRIHSTGGGGAAFGSNSMMVAEINSAGAGSNTSRDDHMHAGIGTITASGSNTLQRGTVNLRAGSGVIFSLSDSDGDGELDTLTFLSSGGGGGAGGTTVFDGKAFIWTPPSSPNAVDDEFNDTTNNSGPNNGLDAQWTKRNLGTSSWLKLDDSISPGGLLFDIPTAQTIDQSIYQTVPAGDWTIMARFSIGDAGTRQMWALYCVNSSGTGTSISFDTGPSLSTPYIAMRDMTTWQQAATTTDFAVEGPIANVITRGLSVTAFLRKSGSDYLGSFTFSEKVISPSGLREVSRTPTAFTAAYIGFGRIYDSGSGAGRVTLEAFRRIA